MVPRPGWLAGRPAGYMAGWAPGFCPQGQKGVSQTKDANCQTTVVPLNNNKKTIVPPNTAANSRKERLRTVTPPPARAPRAPFASTTCAPSVPHEIVGSMRASMAYSACTSLIFVRCASRCASPPGSACAALEPYYVPHGPPRGSTCGPRGAGSPSGPWGSTHTCSAAASSVGRQWTSCPCHPHAPAPSGCRAGGVVRGCSGAHPHRATRGTPPQLPMCGSRAAVLLGRSSR